MNLYQHINFNELNPVELVDYIMYKHHAYESRILALIEDHIHMTYTCDQANGSGLGPLREAFGQLKKQFGIHMQKEQEILFPFVKEVIRAQGTEQADKNIRVRLIEGSIGAMRSEHEQMSLSMAEIRRITNNYTCLPGTCETLRLCYAELQDFEQDLHAHIYLENQILFPKLVAFEKEMMKEIGKEY